MDIRFSSAQLINRRVWRQQSKKNLSHVACFSTGHIIAEMLKTRWQVHAWTYSSPEKLGQGHIKLANWSIMISESLSWPDPWAKINKKQINTVLACLISSNDLKVMWYKRLSFQWLLSWLLHKPTCFVLPPLAVAMAWGEIWIGTEWLEVTFEANISPEITLENVRQLSCKWHSILGCK